MKRFIQFNILMLLSLSYFVNIGFAQENFVSKKGVQKVLSNQGLSTFEGFNNIKLFREVKNKQTSNGLSDYFIITKLDTAVESFAYITPIYIYTDSLLVTSIDNTSDKNLPNYEHDNV